MGLILSTSICTVLCGQLILIFFNNELYCSVKNCVNNNVSGSEIFDNIRKEWIEPGAYEGFCLEGGHNNVLKH